MFSDLVGSKADMLPKKRICSVRSRLYHRRFLRPNTRWKALDEIYKFIQIPHSPRGRNSQFFAKFRQNIFQNV